MIRFTVAWLEDGLDQLADAWVRSSDRAAVTRAALEVDHRLAYDPQLVGEPLSEGLRKLKVRPLLVAFSVREPDRLVEISGVKLVE